MRTYVFEDLLVRTLRHAGYKVQHVMNITDVGHLVGDGDDGEDKMAVAAKRENKRSYEIAEYYTNIFLEDCDKLNITRPQVVCKATDHIEEMIDLIKQIEANGYTYTAGGNVYFDVAKFDSYGALAKLDLEKLKAGARIEVDTSKRNPQDFALWFTKSKFENQELQWDSPWGRGYPGWHIECSAMSLKHLSDQFDIHCGGIDHIPVHHTNEIAQTEAATGKSPWVNYWMHGEFLLMNNAKMAKSAGGFLKLGDVVERGIDPIAYKFFCLSAHYRAQLNFSWEALEQADSSIRKLKRTVLALKEEGEPGEHNEDTPQLSEFKSAIYNDLNAPKALAALWSAVQSKELSSAEKLRVLYEMDSVLGFGMQEWEASKEAIPEHVQTLFEQRTEARANKNWEEADRIRDEITEAGYQVVDSPEGAKLERL